MVDVDGELNTDARAICTMPARTAGRNDTSFSMHSEQGRLSMGCV